MVNELDEFTKRYNLLVAGRLKNAISTMGIEQIEIVKQCQAQGIMMSASKLNKMMNSGSGLQTCSVALICENLGLDMNEVLSTDPDKYIHIPDTPPKKPLYRDPPQLIRNPYAREFDKYIGEYYVVFNQTKSGEKGHHLGVMEMKPSEDKTYCEVLIKIPIVNDDGEQFEKEYKGNAVISTRMRSIYITVESEFLGEIVFINMSFMHLNYTELKCRVGAVVTTSTGDNHMPTMEKIIIIRKDNADDVIPEELLSFLDGELRLNSAEILITVDDYKRFLKELNKGFGEIENEDNSTCMQNWAKYRKEFKDIFLSEDNEAAIPGIQPRSYYVIPESIIRESQMSQLAIAQTLARLRTYSSAKAYNKVSRKGNERIYLMLREWRKEAEKANALRDSGQ